jgi:hypothetical protein
MTRRPNLSTLSKQSSCVRGRHAPPLQFKYNGKAPRENKTKQERLPMGTPVEEGRRHNMNEFNESFPYCYFLFFFVALEADALKVS